MTQSLNLKGKTADAFPKRILMKALVFWVDSHLSDYALQAAHSAFLADKKASRSPSFF